jgi:acetyl-CoA acetyltransferase
MKSTRFTARGKVAVVGYAQSPIQRRASVPLGALAVETCLKAIADAGLKREQVDGFTTGSLLPAASAHTNIDGVDIVTANWLQQRLAIRPRWTCGFMGGGQLPGAVILAIDAIAAGAADYVLVHRALYNPPGRYHENPMREAPGSAQWSAPYGFWGPPVMMALPYMQYMQRYGARREDMATLLVQIRKNAARIPWAYWYDKPITREDYLNARMVADPMSILDCDIPVSAVTAFVLTSAERARDLPHKPVYVAGYAQGLPRGAQPYATADEIIDGGEELARNLWENSGLSRDDIDVPQLYDGFAPLVYFWLESLGFCPRGEAHRFIQGGRIAADGPFPLLSGGGSLGNGRVHGVPHMLECYLQLAQRAGERQLARANVGIACHSFPHIGGAVVYTAAPL